MSEFKIGNVATNSNAAANNLFQSSIDTINKGVQGFTSSLSGIGDNVRAEKVKKDEQSFLSFSTKVASVSDANSAELLKQETLSLLQSNPNAFGSMGKDVFNLVNNLPQTVQEKELASLEFGTRKLSAEDALLNQKEQNSILAAQDLISEGKFDQAKSLLEPLQGSTAKKLSTLASKDKQAKHENNILMQAAQAENLAYETDDTSIALNTMDKFINDEKLSPDVRLKIANQRNTIVRESSKLSDSEKGMIDFTSKNLESILLPAQKELATKQAELSSLTTKHNAFSAGANIDVKDVGLLKDTFAVLGIEAEDAGSVLSNIQTASTEAGFRAKFNRSLSAKELSLISWKASDDLDNFWNKTAVLTDRIKEYMAELEGEEVKKKTLSTDVTGLVTRVQSGQLEVERTRNELFNKFSTDTRYGRNVSSLENDTSVLQSAQNIRKFITPEKAVTATEIIGSGQTAEQLKAGQAQFLKDNPSEDINKPAVEKTETPTAKAESALKTEAAKPSKSLKDTRLLDILSGALSKTGEVISNRQEAFKEEQTQARVDKLFKKLATGKADASDIERMDIDFSAYINDDQQKILDALLKK